MSDPEAIVRAFLIADVRGYTSYTQTHGDEAAGALAASFAACVRDAVSSTGGAVVELRGDEALCVFPSARQALRGAVELQRRFRQPTDAEHAFPLGVGVDRRAWSADPSALPKAAEFRPRVRADLRQWRSSHFASCSRPASS